jgi:copper chaperone CopZ
MGRKVPGVEEVRVYPDSQEIHVKYGGDPAALEAIIRIVSRLGYEARLRTGE